MPLFCFADNKIPETALKKLSAFAEVIVFETSNITYESISGHPDIFLCKMNDKLVIAPNLPVEYKTKLQDYRINYVEGELPVGKRYPDTVSYNAVFTGDTLIHNFRYTDPKITSLADDMDLSGGVVGFMKTGCFSLETWIEYQKGIN